MCRRCPSAQATVGGFLNSQLALSQAHDGTVELTAAGAWTASNADELERLVQLREVQRLDPRLPEANSRGRVTLRALESLGGGVSEIARDVAIFIDMVGALTMAVLRLLRQPMKFRLTSAVHHLDRVGWQAVPIILLITFLIAGIISQQGFFHFRKFGADEYVVDMVGILVLREIGVLIVAIMVAGRSGSSYTAELGAMKMREEIDALRTAHGIGCPVQWHSRRRGDRT
jgi:phospholipid/cholesterol/gamma-HCH transport system permease protein